jgi:hypothetical protein
MMMVAFFRHWAAAQAGGEDLVHRLHTMMHLDRDPLDPSSAARWVLFGGRRGSSGGAGRAAGAPEPAPPDPSNTPPPRPPPP